VSISLKEIGSTDAIGPGNVVITPVFPKVIADAVLVPIFKVPVESKLFNVRLLKEYDILF
jgi:hypothetical protein